jgi:hypothetical protein
LSKLAAMVAMVAGQIDGSMRAGRIVGIVEEGVEAMAGRLGITGAFVGGVAGINDIVRGISDHDVPREIGGIVALAGAATSLAAAAVATAATPELAIGGAIVGVAAAIWSLAF